MPAVIGSKYQLTLQHQEMRLIFKLQTSKLHSLNLDIYLRCTHVLFQIIDVATHDVLQNKGLKVRDKLILHEHLVRNIVAPLNCLQQPM